MWCSQGLVDVSLTLPDPQTSTEITRSRRVPPKPEGLLQLVEPPHHHLLVDTLGSSPRPTRLALHVAEIGNQSDEA